MVNVYISLCLKQYTKRQLFATNLGKIKTLVFNVLTWVHALNMTRTNKIEIFCGSEVEHRSAEYVNLRVDS